MSGSLSNDSWAGSGDLAWRALPAEIYLRQGTVPIGSAQLKLTSLLVPREQKAPKAVKPVGGQVSL